MMKKSVQTSLGSSLIRKPLLLHLPWMMMSRTHHLNTLPSFSPPNFTLESDVFWRRYLAERGLRAKCFDEMRADLKKLRNFQTAIAERYVESSLVRLDFQRDGETLIILPGTIMRSDGIIATSASRLSFLKTSNKKQLKDIKVDVKFLMGGTKQYKGVLLDADLCSNIAFVRIRPRWSIPRPALVKTGDLFLGRGLLASSCITDFSFSRAAPGFSDGDDVFFIKCSGMGCTNLSDFARRFIGIGNCIANSETSSQIIKACVTIRDGTTATGGCLVVPGRGVVGIIHHEDHVTHQIEATPVDLIVKHLEGFKRTHWAVPQIEPPGLHTRHS